MDYSNGRITQNPITKVFTGWDETGTWVIHSSIFHSQVMLALKEYEDNKDRRKSDRRKV